MDDGMFDLNEYDFMISDTAVHSLADIPNTSTIGSTGVIGCSNDDSLLLEQLSLATETPCFVSSALVPAAASANGTLNDVPPPSLLHPVVDVPSRCSRPRPKRTGNSLQRTRKVSRGFAEEDDFLDLMDQPGSMDTLGRSLRFYPHGLSLWRETTIGQCLMNALEELTLELSLPTVITPSILESFDMVMTQELSRVRASGHMKIISGWIVKYKNLDGTWDFYVSDFRVKDRKRCFISEFIRIVAVESDALKRAIRKSSQKGQFPPIALPNKEAMF